MEKKYNYLVEVTFYTPGEYDMDTEAENYLISSDYEITEEEMRKMLNETNKYLDLSYGYDDDEIKKSPISFSYEDEGMNIDTLISGLEEYSKTKICPTCQLEQKQYPFIVYGMYKIEQWQSDELRK